jgi:hypothetical protein
MSEENIIKELLSLDCPMDGGSRRQSTIILVFRSARFLCANDLSSGKETLMDPFVFENQLYLSTIFSGIINYLIFLEQIGSVFKPKNQQKIKGKTNGIHKTLKYFSVLNENEISILIGLRNSLIHKYGLATEKKPKNSNPFKFTLSFKESSNIVEEAKKQWDGDFKDKTSETQTIIYTKKIIELCEEIYKKLLQESEDKNLEIVLNGGLDELFTRYTII